MRALARMAVVHLTANVILLGLAYYWLGIAESRTSTLLWSFCVAAMTFALACCAYGAALVYFQEKQIAAAWRTTLLNLSPLAIAGLSVVIVYFLLSRWAEYSSKPAFQIAAFLTLKLRKPVRPNMVGNVFDAVLWIVRWVVMPVLIIPVLSGVASKGWSGFRSFKAMWRRWAYWIEVPLLLLCAFWLPLKLLAWVPKVGGFAMEAVSFGIRAAVAYLLFGIAALLLAFVTSRGKPFTTQFSSAASP